MNDPASALRRVLRGFLTELDSRYQRAAPDPVRRARVVAVSPKLLVRIHPDTTDTPIEPGGQNPDVTVSLGDDVVLIKVGRRWWIAGRST